MNANTHYHAHALTIASNWWYKQLKADKDYILSLYRKLKEVTPVDFDAKPNESYYHQRRVIGLLLPRNVTVNQLKEAVGI